MQWFDHTEPKDNNIFVIILFPLLFIEEAAQLLELPSSLTFPLAEP